MNQGPFLPSNRKTVKPDPAQNRPRTVITPMTLTVGPTSGDLVGGHDKVLQAGMDYLHRLGGGGILRILPGRYAMNNALYLRPGVPVRFRQEVQALPRSCGLTQPPTSIPS